MTTPNNIKDRIKGKIDELQQDDEKLRILKDPLLFFNITEKELSKKIVGEGKSIKVIFLCAQGRLVINSQCASYNLLVNDHAGTGKDYVTQKVLEILPKEDYIHKTRISPTVFTYWHNANYEPEWTWDGKVFYPEDISEVVLNSDVFKVMCSSGSSATIVIKQRAIDIDICGKPVIITTAASATPSPELIRRFAILNLDGTVEQTTAIMRKHSQFKKTGLIPEYDPRYSQAMGLLKRVGVKIPFADMIDSHFPAKNIIMRTNYPRFLDFIAASAAFHQYQREIDLDGYVLAQSTDYEIAKICFITLFSNRYMIPLTINQKQILQSFKEDAELKGSVTYLHGHGMNHISDRALSTNLQTMVRYGFLKVDTEKDSYGRDIEVYSLSQSYDPSELLDLPPFEDLCKKTSPSSESSLSSITSTSSELAKIPKIAKPEIATKIVQELVE